MSPERKIAQLKPCIAALEATLKTEIHPWTEECLLRELASKKLTVEQMTKKLRKKSN